MALMLTLAGRRPLWVLGAVVFGATYVWGDPLPPGYAWFVTPLFWFGIGGLLWIRALVWARTRTVAHSALACTIPTFTGLLPQFAYSHLTHASGPLPASDVVAYLTSPILLDSYAKFALFGLVLGALLHNWKRKDPRKEPSNQRL